MFENNYNDLVTIEELCEMLMIGRNYAYRLLNSNSIVAFRVGRTWKIPRKAVEEYVRRMTGLTVQD